MWIIFSRSLSSDSRRLVMLNVVYGRCIAGAAHHAYLHHRFRLATPPSISIVLLLLNPHRAAPPPNYHFHIHWTHLPDSYPPPGLPLLQTYLTCYSSRPPTLHPTAHAAPSLASLGLPHTTFVVGLTPLLRNARGGAWFEQEAGNTSFARYMRRCLADVSY